MAIYMWREYQPPELCFTANTAGSTVQLTQNRTPIAVSLETSTDGWTWDSYTIWDTITLTNIGDKVYFRNTSETTTWFSAGTNNRYQFVLTWSVASSWDITYLINKNWTDTLTVNYCFYHLFYWATALTSAPSLPATTLTQRCYNQMFVNCTNLETLPELPAIDLTSYCYYNMFRWCTKIKLATSQDSTYTNAYRIPTTWTGTEYATSPLDGMFQDTWWTWQGSTPTINTTYYTSNTVV